MDTVRPVPSLRWLAHLPNVCSVESVQGHRRTKAANAQCLLVFDKWSLDGSLVHCESFKLQLSSEFSIIFSSRNYMGVCVTL